MISVTKVALIAVLLLVVALCFGGCASTTGLDQKSPVCEALIGPIKYNSRTPASLRHAGTDLAKDLAIRNRVGINLRCPQYR